MPRSMVTGADDAILELILGGYGAKAPFMEKSRQIAPGMYEEISNQLPTRGEEIRSRAREEKIMQDMLGWIIQPDRDTPTTQGTGQAQIDLPKLKAQRDKSLKARDDILKQIDLLNEKIDKSPKGSDSDMVQVQRLMDQKSRAQERLGYANEDLSRNESTYQYAQMGNIPGGYMSIDRGAQKPATEMSELERAAAPQQGGELSPGRYGAPPGRQAISPGPEGYPLEVIPPVEQTGQSLYEKATKNVQDIPGHVQDKMAAQQMQIEMLMELIREQAEQKEAPRERTRGVGPGVAPGRGRRGGVGSRVR